LRVYHGSGRNSGGAAVSGEGCPAGCPQVAAEQQASGHRSASEPGQGDQQRPTRGKPGVSMASVRTRETAVAGQEVRPGRRDRVEHGVLGDAEIEKGHQEGDQGQAASQQRIGRSDQPGRLSLMIADTAMAAPASSDVG
jgi:hypothetical protein